MAIKIKKKDGTAEAEPEAETALEVAGAAGELSEDADPFLRAAWQTESWVEENRTMIVGGVLAVVLAIVGGYLGLGFLENQKVQASSALSPAFESYNTILEGSKEHEAIKSNPDLPAPKQTYKTDKERWEAVYAAADSALKQHANSEIGLAATLSKAAAAQQLEKYDEAISLYESYQKSSKDDSMKLAALQGLATTYSAAQKWDDAARTLDEIASLNEAFAPGARYQKARVLERAGKAEEAKKLYHEILDKDADHPSKADIERRLANM